MIDIDSLRAHVQQVIEDKSHITFGSSRLRDILLLLDLADAAKRHRLRNKPLAMSEDEFWGDPTINTHGDDTIVDLHRALFNLGVR